MEKKKKKCIGIKVDGKEKLENCVKAILTIMNHKESSEVKSHALVTLRELGNSPTYVSNNVITMK